MAFPVSGNYETRISGTTTIKKAWGDATDAAFNGLSGGSRTVVGLQMDGTGYTSESAIPNAVNSIGAALVLMGDDVGTDVTKGNLQHSASGYSFIHSDSAIDYGNGGQSVPFLVKGVTGSLGQTWYGSNRTTDFATTKTLIAIQAPISTGTFHVIASLSATQTDGSKGVIYLSSQGFRIAAGTLSNVASSLTVLSNTDEIGVGIMTWAIVGTTIQFHVTGKVATTIDWTIKVDVIVAS